MEEESILNEEEVVETETVEMTTTTDNTEILQEIHNDLGIITCFIVFFTLVIILKYAYKFFNMIFNF